MENKTNRFRRALLASCFTKLIFQILAQLFQTLRGCQLRKQYSLWNKEQWSQYLVTGNTHLLETRSSRALRACLFSLKMNQDALVSI